MRWTLLGVAIAICALGGLAWAVGPAEFAGDAAPLSGLAMIVAGAVVLGRPMGRLAGGVGRLGGARVVGLIGLAGVLSLAGAVGLGVVLGPSGGGATWTVVLAMMGVSLLAAGSSVGGGAGASGRADPVDPRGVPGWSTDAERPGRARAA